MCVYSTGSYIQHLIITYNGKESEKEYIDIDIDLNHFALHLKLTWHCKSTLLQLEKKTLWVWGCLPDTSVPSHRGHQVTAHLASKVHKQLKSRDWDPGRAVGEIHDTEALPPEWIKHELYTAEGASREAHCSAPCMSRTLVHSDRSPRWK